MDYSLSVWISILQRQRKIFIQKKLEAYGVLSGYPFLILTLGEYPGINQEQISSLLKIDKAAVTRAIIKLEKEDFVRREQDKTDKRAYRVFLTPKAEAVVPEVRKAMSAWEALIVAGIPEQHLPNLRRYIKQMSDNAVMLHFDGEFDV